MCTAQLSPIINANIKKTYDINFFTIDGPILATLWLLRKSKGRDYCLNEIAYKKLMKRKSNLLVYFKGKSKESRRKINNDNV